MAMSARRTRQLAAVLRDVLERSDLSRRQIAERLDVGRNKVNAWFAETDPTPPSSEQVAAILALLNVVGDERDRIVHLARTDEPDWLMSGPTGMNPQLALVMDCERDASAITAWAPLVIPGLLQTSDYARTIIARGNPDLSSHEIENMVMMRNARRDLLVRLKPVTLHAYIGLPAIHGGIGGRDVMVDQLNHVLDISRRDNVTIQAVDLSGDWRPAHAGQFVIYESQGLPPTVYLEHHRSGSFLDSASEVAAYQNAVQQLQEEAMSPDRTAGLIAEVIAGARALETTT